MALFLSLCLFVNGQEKYPSMDQCPPVSKQPLYNYGIFSESSQKDYYVVGAI